MTSVPMLCGFSAAFLHYFMLVFFAWTAVEAIWLYIKLVKVIGTQSSENLYILKAGIPAWGEFKNSFPFKGPEKLIPYAVHGKFMVC